MTDAFWMALFAFLTALMAALQSYRNGAKTAEVKAEVEKTAAQLAAKVEETAAQLAAKVEATAALLAAKEIKP